MLSEKQILMLESASNYFRNSLDILERTSKNVLWTNGDYAHEVQQIYADFKSAQESIMQGDQWGPDEVDNRDTSTPEEEKSSLEKKMDDYFNDHP